MTDCISKDQQIQDSGNQQTPENNPDPLPDINISKTPNTNDNENECDNPISNCVKNSTNPKSEANTQTNPKPKTKAKDAVFLDFQNSRSNIGPTALNNDSKKSLQDSFNLFRKKKIEKVKYKNYLKDKAKQERSDPKFKEALRAKFVETAKKYFGIPYKRKYHEEGTEMYNSPIFLDCCALVRQCVYDLREEFGFQLGKWNQAYQIDTLPNEVPFEELKPGDLIFYSGTYYPEKKSKPQKHDMVHVEIFIGGETGEATIGARWAKDVVKVFPSYKFVSKAYYDIKHYYRSIDTWLDGICKSFCPEHSWHDRYDADRIDKKSVLYAENVESDCDNEDDIENEELEEQVIVKNNTAIVGEGNNHNFIRSYFVQKGWKVLDKIYDRNFSLKWMQLTQDIDYSSMVEGEQMANHLPMLKNICHKQRLLTTMTDYYWYKFGEDQYKQKQHELMPKTYRLDNSGECLAFLDDTEDGLWVEKRFFMNRGLGVKLVYDTAEYKEDLQYRKKFTPSYGTKGNNLNDAKNSKENPTGDNPTNLKKSNSKKSDKDGDLAIVDNKKKSKHYENVLVQKYIEKPFLYDENLADLRSFGIVQSVNPYIVQFHKGYIRRASEPFVYEGEKSRRSYLTSFFSQKKHPDYDNIKEKLIVTTKKFEQRAKDDFGFTDEKIEEKIWSSVKDKLVDCFAAVKDKMDKKKGLFEILGCDFMFSENLEQNYLIEINSNPAMGFGTKVLKEVLTHVVTTVLFLFFNFKIDFG